MVKLFLLSVALLLTWSPPVAAQTGTFDLKEWPVEWGGRTRDPAVAPDGKVWFVGQEGNYIANLDPKTGQQKKFTIEDGTHPHTLIVDEKGIVWYAGNRNGRIGRLDPATGAIKVIMTGEAKDLNALFAYAESFADASSLMAPRIEVFEFKQREGMQVVAFSLRLNWRRA